VTRSERSTGPAAVLDSLGGRIPAGVRDLTSFRAWALSDRFPERGRIDFRFHLEHG
jgi:hypothetical protein